MPVIAVINRKGGSGKSTLATHLAAWLAQQDVAVMLGDVDRQQSTKAWLKRRPAHLPHIAPWAIDPNNVLKPPHGVTHVVLDTPGGLRGFELARVIMSADAVLVPVCHSMFDRDSAAACLAELQSLPRISSGRCKLGVIGMRLDARTKAAESLREWALALQQNFLGVLRETQTYVRSLDNGRTLFDAPSTHAQDLAQWAPILEWLRPVLGLVPPVAPEPVREPVASNRVQSPRAASLMPAQESMVHGTRLTVFASAPRTGANEDGGLDLPRAAPAKLDKSVPQYLLRR
jgi:chromosome partitioning protein